MEDELDEIEEGKLPWRDSVKEFWDRFEQDLDKAKGEMESYKAGIPTSQKCEKCGQGELLERISRHGFFLGCSRYPECDFTRDLAEPGAEELESETATEYCENCGKEMAIKRGRFGPFLACTGYPECKTTRRLVRGTRKAHQPDVPLDEKCPTCGSQLLRRHGRYGVFIGCQNYPKCKYTRPITLGIKCPKCGEGEFVRRGFSKGRRRLNFYGCSRYPDCDFTTPHEPIGEPCPKCGAPFTVEKRIKHGHVRACLRENCNWEAPAPERAPVATTTAVPASHIEPQPVGATTNPSKA
jgi:DNA topoisomerase-1